MEKYESYGDQWLALHDMFSRMEPQDAVMFELTNSFGLIPPLEMAYIVGAKETLKRQVAWLIGVNKVLRSDPAKYTPILEKRGLVMNNGKIDPPKKIKNHNYIQ